MGFDKKEASKLLAACHRRCCVCHKFCGVKMELDHMEQHADKGSDEIENAIPLCFECHAEVHHYNDHHPKGRKFTIEELLLHKQQWLDICEKHPESLMSAPRNVDVGPLEGMLLELEYNQSLLSQMVDGSPWQDKIGFVLHDKQYQRAVESGSLLLLSDELRGIVNEAYSKVGRVNTFTRMYSNTRPEGNAFGEATNRLLETYRASALAVSTAYSSLNTFLTS